MPRALSQSVIDRRLQSALKAADDCGLTVYGYRIGESGDVHIITNAAAQTKSNEAEKWFAEN